MLAIQIKPIYIAVTGCVLCILYLAIIILGLNSYYLWNANLLIGLLLAPYICSVDAGKFSLRYLVPAILFIILAAFIPVRTTIFLAILFSFLLFLENYFGRISSMLLFLLILISPIFKYVSNVIGFPIRLWLSDIAASILRLAGTDTQAYGNVILQGKNEFTVDQACAGLNMLATSLIICLFIMAYYQKRSFKRIPIVQVLLFLTLTIGLNIACNLIRIVLLVQFKIAPESIYHDLIGVLCLLVYVILPLLFLIKAVVRYAKNLPEAAKGMSQSPDLRYPLLHLFFLVVILIISVNLKSVDQIAPSINTLRLKGYQKTVLDNGILKFENNECLVYLKSGTFYAPEHDPMVCWKGSGYTFNSIKKEKVGDIEIYSGVLEKGKDKIYSAWWFDNGKIKTINQFTWRWKAAKGEGNFYLVNANAQNESDLKRITTSLLSQNLNP